MSAAYNRQKEAIDLTQRLLEKSPRDPQLLDARLTSLAALSRHEQLMGETAALLEKLETDHLAYAVALERRLQALLELGRNDRATEDVRELLTRDPDRCTALALA